MIGEIQAEAEGVLRAIGESARHMRYPLTGFFPMRGSLYCGDLMIVGRAVNGWTRGVSATDLGDPAFAASYAQHVWQSVSGDAGCPMMWVTAGWGASRPNYNTRKSAFWRVIRRCVSMLGIANVEESSWPSHLVWSNLYKVSPADGYNPSENLCRIQEAACISLLHAEICHFQPRRLLFLTGRWAEPFWRGLASDVLQHDSGGVEVRGTINHHGGSKTKFVVAPHPMGKGEDLIVRAVVEAFSER